MWRIGELLALGERQQRPHLVARIDEHRVSASSSHPTTKPFLKKGPTACVSIIMVSMILAVLDDLMFTSKIRTTANQLGVTVAFARSAEAALAEMRRNAPSLVIFDLNNSRTHPLAIVGADEG